VDLIERSQVEDKRKIERGRLRLDQGEPEGKVLASRHLAKRGKDSNRLNGNQLTGKSRGGQQWEVRKTGIPAAR